MLKRFPYIRQSLLLFLLLQYCINTHSISQQFRQINIVASNKYNTYIQDAIKEWLPAYNITQIAQADIDPTCYVLAAVRQQDGMLCVRVIHNRQTGTYTDIITKMNTTSKINTIQSVNNRNMPTHMTVSPYICIHYQHHTRTPNLNITYSHNNQQTHIVLKQEVEGKQEQISKWFAFAVFVISVTIIVIQLIFLIIFIRRRTRNVPHNQSSVSDKVSSRISSFR